MSQTTPPTVDALPVAPDTSSPSTFSSRMDAFLAAMITLRTQLVALGTNVYNNAVDCYNNAAAAAASSTSATAAANSAAATTGVTIWVSGTTYAIGECRFSPINSGTYRRKTAGAGTTDPASDPTNWALISFGGFPYVHVREEQASGTSAGASISGTQVRVLNTVVGTNSIAGSSLASNLLTLPAGTYDFEAIAPASQASSTRLTLYNNTDSADIMVGHSQSADTVANTGINTQVFCHGRFTLAAQKTVKLNHYTATAVATYGLGAAISTGQVEVYSSLKLWKVA